MSELGSVNTAHVNVAKHRLFQQRVLATPGASPNYGADAVALSGPTGGNATDPALLAQTDQLLRSPNVRDKFQAIVNLTKVSPQDAIPRLEGLLNSPGQDPQVVQLASEALRVMRQMSQQQPTQPGTPQGTQPSTAPSGQPVNPAPSTYQAQPVAAPTYNPGVNLSHLSLADAQFMLQTLQTDLRNPQNIRELAALAQAHPQLKEPVYNLLLHHAYHSVHPSVAEALRALGGFNDPKLIPYLQMIQRSVGHTSETNAVAVQLLKQLSAQTPGAAPGAAAASTGPSVEYIRAMEYELRSNETAAMDALGHIRQALGSNPKAQTPLRAEIIRVLLTHVAKSSRPSTVTASIRILGEMGAREMNTLQYLDAVVRSPSQSATAQQAARDAIRQILATPSTTP